MSSFLHCPQPSTSPSSTYKNQPFKAHKSLPPSLTTPAWREHSQILMFRGTEV